MFGLGHKNTQGKVSEPCEVVFTRLVRCLMFFILAIYPFGLATIEIWKKRMGYCGLMKSWWFH